MIHAVSAKVRSLHTSNFWPMMPNDQHRQSLQFNFPSASSYESTTLFRERVLPGSWQWRL